jgi:hypothetical protein
LLNHSTPTSSNEAKGLSLNFSEDQASAESKGLNIGLPYRNPLKEVRLPKKEVLLTTEGKREQLVSKTKELVREQSESVLSETRLITKNSLNSLNFYSSSGWRNYLQRVNTRRHFSLLRKVYFILTYNSSMG